MILLNFAYNFLTIPQTDIQLYCIIKNLLKLAAVICFHQFLNSSTGRQQLLIALLKQLNTHSISCLAVDIIQMFKIKNELRLTQLKLISQIKIIISQALLIRFNYSVTIFFVVKSGQPIFCSCLSTHFLPIKITYARQISAIFFRLNLGSISQTSPNIILAQLFGVMCTDLFRASDCSFFSIMLFCVLNIYQAGNIFYLKNFSHVSILNELIFLISNFKATLKEISKVPDGPNLLSVLNSSLIGHDDSSYFNLNFKQIYFQQYSPISQAISNPLQQLSHYDDDFAVFIFKSIIKQPILFGHHLQQSKIIDEFISKAI